MEVLYVKCRMDALMPKISIITVCYNSVQTLEQTIQSVVNQTYNNIEYIIIDGGSVDGTQSIIKKYENKIAYWVSEPDSGIYDAMNKGINQATGDYLQFLGSDDCLISSNIIEKVVAILLTDKDIDILSGSVWIVDEKLHLQKLYSNQFTKNDVYNGYVIPHQGIFTRRNLLQKLKFDTSYNIVGDYDFFLKCYLKNSVNLKCVNLEIAFYSGSGISSSAMIQRLAEHINVMKKYNLNQEAISKLQNKPGIYNQLFKYFRNCLKSLLYSIGCMRFIRIIFSGWKAHSCEWKGCRWCKSETLC